MADQKIPAVTWQAFDQLHEGIIIADPDGVIRYLNPAVTRLFGLRQNGHPPTLVSQIITDPAIWKKLRTPPAKTRLQLPNGRILQLRAISLNEVDQPLLQILANPAEETASSNKTSIPRAQLEALTKASHETDFDTKLQLLVNGLQLAGWQRVLLTLRDAEFNATRIIAAGFDPQAKKQLHHHLIPGHKWLSFFVDPDFEQFRHNYCYFIPGDSKWLQKNIGTTPLLAENQNLPVSKDAEDWHPQDILCIPLVDRDQNRIGLLSVDRPQNGRRPQANTLDIIELYAQFAGAIIENARLVDETLSRSRELEILAQASSDISGMLDQETMFNCVGQYMMTAIGAKEYTVYRWQHAQRKLTVLHDYVSISTRTPLPQNTDIVLKKDAQVARVLTQQQPLATHIVGDNPNLLRAPAWLQGDEHYISILVPVITSGETFGLVELFCEGRHKPITARQEQLLLALANQLGTALETSLLFADTYERERFYNALGSISLALNLTIEQEAMLKLICNEAQRIFEADGAYLWQNEDGMLIGSAAAGDNTAEFLNTAVRLDDEESLIARIAREAEVIYLAEFTNDPGGHLHIPRETAVTSLLGIPLEREAGIVGVLLLVMIGENKQFSDKDVSRGTIFGVQVANALENTRLFSELQSLNAELDRRVENRTQALHEESNRVKILLRITSELSASLDEGHVLTQALTLVNEVVQAKQGVILLLDDNKEEFIFRAGFGLDRPLSPKGEPSGLYRHQGLAGWMVENRAAVIVHDTHKDDRWVERPTSTEHRSVLAVPLITSEDVIGVMMMFHSETDAFDMQQLDLVEAAAIQVANAINNANLYRFISDQANRLGTMLRAEQIETAKSQAILESIADGVLVADDKSTIIVANNPVAKILSIPSDQLVGKSVNELLGLYGKSGDVWVRTIEQWAQHPDTLEPGVALADELNLEEKYVSVHLSPVLAGNQFFGTVSIFRDITKEVEVDRLKTEFVSTVSHELRTPMTSIKGYADLMLMGAAGGLSEPQLRYLQVIKNNANRLHMLVNDLLDISRIETGKTALELRPLDMGQLIEQIVNGHLNGRLQHEDKQLIINTNLEPALPLVNADYKRVTQIITNLVDNAINYTPVGGTIDITVFTNGDYLVTSVHDTGIGISAENIEKIFDRFFRAEDEAVQKVPGTGLGLAIVRNLVDMHGGTLTVNSQPGAGSTFSFNLPIVPDDTTID